MNGHASVFLLLLLLMCTAAGSVHSQSYEPNLYGFFGLKFGSSIQSCKKIMKSKGAKLDLGSSDSTLLWYSKAPPFANRKSYAIILEFSHNRFYRGAVAFESDSLVGSMNLMIDLKGEIEEKYSVRGIRNDTGNIGRGWKWLFYWNGKSLQKKPVWSIVIDMSIPQNFGGQIVALIYTDDNLARAIEEKTDKKSANDH